MRRRSNRSRALRFAFIGLAALATTHRGEAQDGFLHPVTPTEAKTLDSRLDRSLLPTHSTHVEVEAKQVFRLTAAGQEDLLLIPVRFFHWEPSGIDKSTTPRDRCGVFFTMANGGHQQFVWTVTGGDHWAVDQCGGLAAVRRQAHHGPRPPLTLTYKTFAPPRFEDSFDVMLAWDAKLAAYAVLSKTENGSAQP